ncbi:MAG TPA: carboxypeptidase-like regulatory domain-containing protein [Thermoanaerobaculia bacterium]|nr:carboxypeptidase-like regulatory domain-containing protein [Thermoanaerobaculia bacterium]
MARTLTPPSRRVPAFLAVAAWIAAMVSPATGSGMAAAPASPSSCRPAAVFTVVDQVGRPVAGADLVVSHGSDSEPRPDRHRTGADGRVAVPDLPPDYGLVVRASGFALFYEQQTRPEIALDAGGAGGQPCPDLVAGPVMRLQPGRELTGSIRDPQGRPVAGAAVWQPGEVHDSTALSAAYLLAGPSARSGADGRFVLRDLGPDRLQDGIEICRDGFLTAVTGEPPLAAALAVVLTPSAAIAGRVLEPGGAPIFGAQVFASRAGDDPSDLVMFHPCPLEPIGSGWEETDDHGSFRMSPLRDGWYTVRVTATGHLTVTSAPLRLAPGETVGGVEIKAGRGAGVSGRVLTPLGDALPGAEVWLFGKAAQGSATTDGAGRFRLLTIDPASERVEVSHRDYARVSLPVHLHGGENQLELTAGERLYPIAGRVFASDGQPARGVKLRLGPLQSIEEVSSDGGFAFPPVASGSYILSLDQIEQEDAGDTYLPVPVEVHAAAVSGLAIHLTRGGSISGSVLGLSPQERAEVYRVYLGHPRFGPRTSLVDPEGRFSIAGLLPGEWSLAVSSGARSASARVTIPPGDSARLLDLRFPPAYPLSGRVLGPDGEPVAGARIEVGQRERAPSAYVISDAAGGFAAELQNGSYQIAVQHDEYGASLPQPLVMAGEPRAGLELRLSRRVRIHGRILGLAPGEVVFRLVAEGPGGHTSAGQADQDGGYFVDVGVGRWKIEAQLEPYPAVDKASAEVKVASEASAIELDLVFKRAESTARGDRAADRAQHAADRADLLHGEAAPASGPPL